MVDYLLNQPKSTPAKSGEERVKMIAQKAFLNGGDDTDGGESDVAMGNGDDDGEWLGFGDD